MDVFEVRLSRRARDNIKKLPKHIVFKLLAWIDEVGVNGLMRSRRVPAYHDEPLLGKRKGQRSIRLSKAYRGFYVINIDSNREPFVEILEVNKHEY